MTIYYMRTGFFNHISPEQAQEAIKFYKLFEYSKGFYCNGRGDIYAWED